MTKRALRRRYGRTNSTRDKLTEHEYETLRTVLRVGGSQYSPLTMGRSTAGRLRTATVQRLLDAGLLEWQSSSGHLHRRTLDGGIREAILFATGAGAKAVYDYENIKAANSK